MHLTIRLYGIGSVGNLVGNILGNSVASTCLLVYVLLNNWMLQSDSIASNIPTTYQAIHSLVGREAGKITYVLACIQPTAYFLWWLILLFHDMKMENKATTVFEFDYNLINTQNLYWSTMHNWQLMIFITINYNYMGMICVHVLYFAGLITNSYEYIFHYNFYLWKLLIVLRPAIWIF